MSSQGPSSQGGFWPWELDPNYQPTIRASALTSARTCNAYPFLGQAQQIKKRDTGTAYTNVGTIGHKWLELNIQLGRDVADIYFAKHMASVPNTFPQALVEVWDWINDTGLLIKGAELLTEQEVLLRAGTCLVTGHIDLIEVVRSLGVVVDWKFYNDLSWLEPIESDLQMYAYAVGAADLCPELEHVEVHRVACYHLMSHKLELDREALALAREAIAEEVERIWANRTTFSVGAQCLTCLLRRACPAFAKQEQHLDTTEIAPYTAGAIQGAEQAIKVLLAINVVEARIEQARAACKAWVESNGKLSDPVSGKLWGPWASKRDMILDAAAALGQLGKTVGSIDLALQAAKTSKAAMESILLDKKVVPADRRAFFDGLRDKGLVEKRETEPRWEWRNSRGKE